MFRSLLTTTLLCGSLAGMVFGVSPAYAASQPSDPEFDEILSLDIADLTVTSVSKRPQRLNATASAVYVVTREDIKRIGAETIPDALRIVPGLQVAQYASNKWTVSARGFGGGLSNKLLVMVDGRSVYTPVFSGTYWDDRLVPMEEIERIEVIRGPGGSIWGANALNGIIHIITRDSRTDQEDYITASVGNKLVKEGGGYGAKLGKNSAFRAYAEHFDADPSLTRTGAENHDAWDRSHAGLRIDGETSAGNIYNVTAGGYTGSQENRSVLRQRTAPFSQVVLSEDDSSGFNIGGSWEHAFSKDSSGTFKAYLDHYNRLEEIADQYVTNIDLDWQFNAQTSPRNNFTWGLGYRMTMNELEGSFTARVNETHRNFDLFSAFLQDEYALVENKLFLTLGSKFEHNDFTGYEVQPNARLSWLIDAKQTLWASASRAVRSPSIIEDDVNIIVLTQAGPTYTVLFGNEDVQSEKLNAYELGYRVEVTPKLQLDNTVFFNDYTSLTTYEIGPQFFTGLTFVNPYYVDNLGKGHVYGFESAATYQATPSLKLMGSYSYAEMDLDTKPGSNYSLNSEEGRLPKNMFSARAYWNVMPNLNFDNMLYYVDNLGSSVGDYWRYDTRLGWQATPQLELSLIGQNLLDNQHPEFATTPTAEIPRSVIARATYRF